MGIALTLLSTTCGSIERKLVFFATSELSVHTPPVDRKPPVEVLMNAPAWVSRVLSDWKKNPPAARAMNWLTADEAMSAFCESPHTNDPEWLAIARKPAAKLVEPPATLDRPPGTVALLALAVL